MRIEIIADDKSIGKHEFAMSPRVGDLVIPLIEGGSELVIEAVRHHTKENRAQVVCKSLDPPKPARRGRPPKQVDTTTLADPPAIAENEEPDALAEATADE